MLLGTVLACKSYGWVWQGNRTWPSVIELAPKYRSRRCSAAPGGTFVGFSFGVKIQSDSPGGFGRRRRDARPRPPTSHPCSSKRRIRCDRRPRHAAFSPAQPVSAAALCSEVGYELSLKLDHSVGLIRSAHTPHKPRRGTTQFKSVNPSNKLYAVRREASPLSELTVGKRHYGNFIDERGDRRTQRVDDSCWNDHGSGHR
jgi:hypothetical protein